MNNQTTICRHRPAKPEKQKSVELTRKANVKEAIELLNEFIREARREIREREAITVIGTKKDKHYDSVSFLTDSFSLTIDFTKGIRV